MISYLTFYLHFLSISYGFLDIWLQRFLEFDLDLRPLDVTWGQNIFIIRKPIYDCLSNLYWHFLYLAPLSTFLTPKFLGLTFDPWKSA